MKTLRNTLLTLTLTIAALSANETAMNKQTKLIIDFANPPEDVQIGVTNDGVMGGLSKGKVQTTLQGTMLFDGTLSLENNGGFSSLRIRGKQWNLAKWKGLEIKVKGDGRSYGLRCTTDQKHRWSQVSYTADFATKKGEWTTLRVSFSSMRASWRGMKLERPFDPAKISGLGIILADKKSGPFTLEIHSISVWK